MAARGGWIASGLVVMATLAAALLWLAAEPPADRAPAVSAVDATPRQGALPKPVASEATPPAEAAAPAGEPPPVAPQALQGIDRRVTGTVVRLVDGSPLPGALVSSGATTLEEGSPRRASTTEDGHFEVSIPVAERQLYVALWDLSRWVELPAGDGDLAGLQVVVDSGHLVRGRVTNSGGEPIVGAEVSAGTNRWLRARTTDASGDFEFDVNKKLRSPLKISATAAWHMDGEAKVSFPESPSTLAHVDIRLTETGVIEGLITGPDGLPVSGAVITPHLEAADVVGLFFVAPDRVGNELDGSYRLDGLVPGSWLLEVQGVGDLVGCRLEGVEVTAKQATRRDVVLFPGASLSGRVTDAEGRSLKDAHLRVDQIHRWPGPGGRRYVRPANEGRSDDDGHYHIDGLGPGRFRVFVRHPSEDWAPVVHEVEVAGGEQVLGFDLRLAAGAVLSGTVRDEQGEPVAGANVRALALRNKMVMTLGSVRSDEQGRFELRGLPDGPVDLVAYTPMANCRVPAVRPGGDPVELVIVRRPRIFGEVLDARDGSKLRIFKVFVGSGDRRFGFPQMSGVFEMSVQNNDPIDVTVVADGFVEATQVSVIPDDTRGEPLVFRLWPAP